MQHPFLNHIIFSIYHTCIHPFLAIQFTVLDFPLPIMIFPHNSDNPFDEPSRHFIVMFVVFKDPWHPFQSFLLTHIATQILTFIFISYIVIEQDNISPPIILYKFAHAFLIRYFVGTIFKDQGPEQHLKSKFMFFKCPTYTAFDLLLLLIRRLD